MCGLQVNRPTAHDCTEWEILPIRLGIYKNTVYGLLCEPRFWPEILTAALAVAGVASVAAAARVDRLVVTIGG